MKLFLLGATGNCGRRILRLALLRAHEVTAFVRDETKLLAVIGGPVPPNLHVSIGDIKKSAEMAKAMVGHDGVINAAGHVAEGSAFTQLVQTVIDSTMTSLGEGGRLWQLGGAAVLDVPGTHIMGVDLPKVPKVYEAHRTNLDVLRRSPLDWSMLRPGPMIESENGKPTRDLRLSVDEWPVPRPAYTYFLPKLALAPAFKQVAHRVAQCRGEGHKRHPRPVGSLDYGLLSILVGVASFLLQRDGHRAFVVRQRGPVGPVHTPRTAPLLAVQLWSAAPHGGGGLIEERDGRISALPAARERSPFCQVA